MSEARAKIHWGEGASWSDGERGLSFQAGLGVKPAQVYLPSPSVWAERVPEWAAPLRETIARDFRKLGVKVVSLPDASVVGSTR